MRIGTWNLDCRFNGQTPASVRQSANLAAKTLSLRPTDPNPTISGESTNVDFAIRGPRVGDHFRKPSGSSVSVAPMDGSGDYQAVSTFCMLNRRMFVQLIVVRQASDNVTLVRLLSPSIQRTLPRTLTSRTALLREKRWQNQLDVPATGSLGTSEPRLKYTLMRPTR